MFFAKACASVLITYIFVCGVSQGAREVLISLKRRQAVFFTDVGVYQNLKCGFTKNFALHS